MKRKSEKNGFHDEEVRGQNVKVGTSLEQVTGGTSWSINELEEFTVSSRTLVRQRSTHVMRLPLLAVLFFIFALKQCLAEEIWLQDLSMDMEIGASTEGYDRVSLHCGAEKMTVNLKTSESFSGVIYTRGSFYSRQAPCFLDPTRGGNFTINIPFDQCETENVADKYKNILVIQHDDELITPGDAAFVLECDFSKPTDVSVSAALNEPDKKLARSSISLVDADPSRDESKSAACAKSNTNEVVFVPNSIPKLNDEL